MKSPPTVSSCRTSRLCHVWLCDAASPVPSWHRLRRGGVTFGDSTLNTANLCLAISVVGLFYLLTVIMNFVCWSILDVVYSRMSVNVGHMYN